MIRTDSLFQRPRPMLLAGLFAALLVVGLHSQAAPQLEKVLATQYELAAAQPHDATVQNDLGNLLLLAHRDAEAEQAYRRALQLDGGHVGARFNLAVLLQQSGRADEAFDEYEQLLELSPNHAWALYQSGVIHENRGERKAAIENYARAFALDPALTFAENNPHIIDNELATEALLMSSRYVAEPGTRVPRQYDQGNRIALLMLSDEESPEATEDVVAPESSEGAGSDRRADGKPRGRQVRSVEESEETGAGDANEEEAIDLSPAADEETPEEKVRVLTPANIDTSSQVGGTVDRQPPRPPRRVDSPIDQMFERRREAEEQGRDENAAPQRGSRRNQAGGSRYIPNRRSTASLDLELLPAEPTNPDAVAARG